MSEPTYHSADFRTYAPETTTYDGEVISTQLCEEFDAESRRWEPFITIRTGKHRTRAPQRCLNCGAREGEPCLDWCAYKPAGRPMPREAAPGPATAELTTDSEQETRQP